MVHHILLSHLSGTSSFQELHHVVHHFFGLLFTVLGPAGEQTKRSGNGARLSGSPIPAHVLERALENNQTELFSEGNLLRMLMPLEADHPQLQGLIYIEQTPSSKISGHDFHQIAKLIRIVVRETFSRQYFLFPRHKMISPETPRQMIVQKALDYIAANYYDHDISLSVVCKECGVSYHHLCHLIREEMGLTFTDLLLHVRLEAAAHLLKDQRLTVSQIAYLTGFSDSSYFSKAFKRKYRTTPLAYRLRRTKPSRARSRKNLLTIRNPLHCSPSSLPLR